jgi:cytochrome c peroxidase
MFRRIYFILFATTLVISSSAETIPSLPLILHDYTSLVLPDHFLANDIPVNSPFQNAVIANDNTPASNPTTNAGATLGRVIFYDQKLSANGTVSCASCHEQSDGFADSRTLSLGFAGGETRRNSMGLTNARFYQPGKFFWDERAATLEEQVLMPFQDEIEMGLTLQQVVSITQAQDYYPSLFTAAFGNSTINSNRIARALAQFVRSIVSVNSRYDQGRAMVNNPTQNFPNFSNQENQGKQLFFNSPGNGASCIDCHVSEAFISPALGTTHASSTSAATNNGLDRVSTDDLGIAEATGNVDDTGKFKVPSLRNIALTAPYMHDGRFDDLNDVLDFYNGDIENHAQLSDVLRGQGGRADQFNLNGGDRGEIVAFLRTLTDQALVTDPKFSDPFIEVPDEPFTPLPTSDTTHLINLSSRAQIAAGDGVLVPGFVIGGSGSKTLLIRGIGPELAAFGINDGITAPTITLYSGSTALATNTRWTTAANANDIRSVADEVGAFPLNHNRADSAILTTVEPGAYTVHLDDAGGNGGVGLVEIYDTDSDSEAHLVNLSTRAQLAPGGEVIVPGFVVHGDGPTSFLIRAVGPGLEQFNVTAVLRDPQLSVYSGNDLITANDNWFVSGTSAQTEAAANAVGAFAIADTSLDAGVAVTLQPGSYTVHVGSVDNQGGTVLVEIYPIP